MITRVLPSILLLFAQMLACCGCQEQSGTRQQQQPPTGKREHRKPPSSFDDTLVVAPFSAVFYEPDSLQLLKMKAITSEQEFKGSMHEYEFQVKYARQFIREQKKSLKLYHTDHARYLLFEKDHKPVTLIDLDNYDAVGMFVFDGKKPPQPVDMMNVETQVNFYFDSTSKN